MRTWLKWIVALIVVAALGVGAMRVMAQRKAQQASVAAQTSKRTEASVELASTDLVQVKHRVLSQGLPISGTLKAADSAVIKARVAGELQGLTLREGDPVKAGQVVARIDATDAQARVRQAQQQAESAKAQVDIAQRTYDNNRSLVQQGFISKSALDTSSSSLAAAQATYRAAQAGSDMAAKTLADTVLRSPISGLVSQRVAQNGERVAVDGRVLEIVDLSRLELEASLSAADSLQVELGQSAELQIEGASVPVSAKVVRINPSVVAGSRAVLVYLTLQPMKGLRQGLFAQGTLHTGRSEALSVPLSAVRTDKPAPYVQRISNDRVVNQPVQLGARGEADGQIMVAVTGVPEQATLINGSVGTLREGTAVKFTAGTK
ncbi:MAG: efflux RND transporter periplasmic adaptor subunit [Burkholderiaceae bacterium]